MCRNFSDFATCPACRCSQKVVVLPPCYIETWRERTTQPPFQQAKITTFPPQVYGTRINRNPCKHAVRVPAGISRSGFVHPLSGTSARPLLLLGPVAASRGRARVAAVVPGDYNLGSHCAGAVHASFATSYMCVLKDRPRAPPMGAPAAHLAETPITQRWRPSHWGVERIPGLTGTIFVRRVPPPSNIP